MRNEFGSSFSQTQLPSSPGSLDVGLLGRLSDNRVGLGLDVRGAARQQDDPSRDDTLDFSTDRVTAYLSAQLNEHVRVYVDQQFAPGGAINREAWALFQVDNWYIKAGRLFQPYGWRLEDDSAFIRSATNINFNTPDTGIEVGHVGQHFSAQLAVTNGSGGAPEFDDGKQATARLAWIQPTFRLGISASDNSTDFSDRTMGGVFAGFRTGPVAWLVEVDRVEDSLSGAADMTQDLALVEANWLIARGHYLKVTAERRSSRQNSFADSDRFTLEYQWFPLPFTHLRAGVRRLDVDAPGARSTTETYVQMHLYF